MQMLSRPRTAGLLAAAAVLAEQLVSVNAALCPDFSAYPQTDSNGDCQCPAGAECSLLSGFQGAGCPYSAGSKGKTFFFPCTNCKCTTPDTSCPASAQQTRTDQDDCRCSTNSLCYRRGASVAGCASNNKIILAKNQNGASVVTGSLNDTGAFQATCTDCFCQPVEFTPEKSISGQKLCNTEKPECIRSDSSFVAQHCPDDAWHRCCDEDQDGCSRRCCEVTPGWVVALIIVGVGLVAAGLAVGFYFLQSAQAKKLALISPEWHEDERSPEAIVLQEAVFGGAQFPNVAGGGAANAAAPPITAPAEGLPPVRGAPASQPDSKTPRPKSAASARFAGLL